MAFEASGGTREEMFAAAVDAVTNVMIEDLSAVIEQERRPIGVSAEALDLLLYAFLEEIVFLKDAEQLLLRVRDVRIRREGDGWTASAEGWGERIDPSRHPLVVDVKAVTFHRFGVEETPEGWRATAILDI